MCRVLADLLNPKGYHYRGSAYLKLFMDMVVKQPRMENAGKFDLSKAKVTTEYLINEYRRIDIVLEDGSVFIPIEVKIYAGEQEQQLADYAVVSKKKNISTDFIPVLFLTPDGHDSGEASKDEYVPVSFGEHIIPWLQKCLNLEETSKATPVREVLKQLIKAIKSFCGYMEEEEMENAINALITESKDSYASALLIYKAVDSLAFDDRVWEIFKGPIYNLVKNKIADAGYLDDYEQDWFYLSIPIGNDIALSINYDMKKVSIECPSHTSVKIADKIKKKMSFLTGFQDAEDENYTWYSESMTYPGIEDTGDDDMYKYELYQIYSKDPQSVADKIVSWVKELKNI
jgi:hypothetical protein